MTNHTRHAGTAGDDHEQTALAEAYWDAEFAEGRLLDLPPDRLVDRVLDLARDPGLPPGPGLYIGPGNGRNYLPLVAGGLDLIGLDVSSVGLDAIRTRAPGHAGRLVHGDLADLPPDDAYAVVLGLNVFQHGDRARTHAHIRAARERVAPGGLFVVRVNAGSTEIVRPHEIAEESPDGSYTVRYTDGDPGTPGLLSHYFTRTELTDLLTGLETVDPLVLDTADPLTGRPGRRHRWQSITRRPRADETPHGGPA